MKATKLILAATLVVAAASTSYAASDGNYTPEEMGCTNTGNAEGPQAGHSADSGADHCQAYRLSVSTDNNDRIVRVGLDHEEPGPGGFAGGHNPHHGTTYVGSPGQEVLIVHYDTGVQHAIPEEAHEASPVEIPFGDSTDGALSDDHDEPELTYEATPENADKIDTGAPSEVHVYNGADDNLETGEHDGVPEKGCAAGHPCTDSGDDNSDLANGPSDGGAIRVDVTPDQDNPENNVDPDNPNTNPVPAAYAGIGACVDGICFTAGTAERQVYDGGQDGRVYLDDADSDDYKDTDDYCNNNNANNCVRTVHNEQQDFYSHPGITIYEDPDPQDSSLEAPGPDRNTHVGGGGIVILGENILDLH